MSKLIIVLFSLLAVCMPGQSAAQSQEVAQLLLNIEKLRQLEQILDNMYKGYKILSAGYNTVKDIAEGNFNLHKVFLDGLYSVSPVVRDHKRIPYIIRYQQMLARQARRSYERFRREPNLTASEIRYLENVYEHLLKQSLRNVEELLMVVTGSRLRMSDEERIASIDRIYEDVLEKASFLNAFDSGTTALCKDRAKERQQITWLRDLNDITP